MEIKTIVRKLIHPFSNGNWENVYSEANFTVAEIKKWMQTLKHTVSRKPGNWKSYKFLSWAFRRHTTNLDMDLISQDRSIK